MSNPGADKNFVGTNIDPVNHPIEGYARAAVENGESGHFSMPLISHIEGNLWMGGCIDGARLPDDFAHVVSLYPWEKYALGPRTQRYEVEMYDSTTQGFEQVEDIAKRVVHRLEMGKTLVHCQAGLNRSGLIAGRTLMYLGYTAAEAIALLREKRSPVVLCNKHFEGYLRSLVPSVTTTDDEEINEYLDTLVEEGRTVAISIPEEPSEFLMIELLVMDTNEVLESQAILRREFEDDPGGRMLRSVKEMVESHG